jgi:6-phosphogluconolactonase/glucosamine-6-phosphate isomerase/deaminase
MNRYIEPREMLPGRTEDHLRELAQSVRGLMKGKGNNGHIVTLEPNSTQTEVTVEHSTAEAIATFHPMSASAAATLSAIWTETRKGKVVVHHDAQPDTDRTIGLVMIG